MATKAAAATKVTAINEEAAQGRLTTPTPASVALVRRPMRQTTYAWPSNVRAHRHGGRDHRLREGATADDDPKFMQAMDFGDGRTMHVRVEFR